MTGAPPPGAGLRLRLAHELRQLILLALFPVCLQGPRRPRPRLRLLPSTGRTRLHRAARGSTQLFTHKLGVELVLVSSVARRPFPTGRLHVVHLPLRVGERRSKVVPFRHVVVVGLADGVVLRLNSSSSRSRRAISLASASISSAAVFL